MKSFFLGIEFGDISSPPPPQEHFICRIEKVKTN